MSPIHNLILWLCVVIGIAGPTSASDSIADRCVEYNALLDALDCPESFAAIDSFLKTTRSLIAQLRVSTPVAAYRDALAKTGRVIQNCLVKLAVSNDDDRTKALIDAHVKFTTFFAGVDYWTDKGDPPASAAETVLRQHDEAAMAISAAMELL